MNALHNIRTGETMSAERVEANIREHIRRVGFFQLSSIVEEPIGTVQSFAGVPWRIVRYLSLAEATACHEATKDLWGDGFQPDEIHFEVVVAD